MHLRCLSVCVVKPLRVACQELEDRIVSMESTYRAREADLHNLMSELKMDRTLQLELQRQQFQRALEVHHLPHLACSHMRDFVGLICVQNVFSDQESANRQIQKGIGFYTKRFEQIPPESSCFREYTS